MEIDSNASQLIDQIAEIAARGLGGRPDDAKRACELVLAAARYRHTVMSVDDKAWLRRTSQ